MTCEPAHWLCLGCALTLVAAGCDDLAPAPSRPAIVAPAAGNANAAPPIQPDHRATRPATQSTRAALQATRATLQGSGEPSGAHRPETLDETVRVLRATGALVVAEPWGVVTLKAGPADGAHPPKLAANHFDLIAECRTLAFLKLDRTGMTDADLLKLAPLRQLQFLDISHNHITDEGATVFEYIDGLGGLKIDDTQLTDEGLCRAARNRGLFVLFANHLAITDKAAECIASMPSVWFLELAGAQITNAGLEKLTALRNLGHLVLTDAKIDDAGLAQLAKFPRLRELDLSGCDIHGPGLEHLVKLPIEWLKLNGTSIDDQAVEYLKQIKAPMVIEVRDTRMTAEGVQKLKAALPKTGIRHSTEPKQPPKKK